MSFSCQVRSTTASLLLGIAGLVIVLPSAALWSSPSSSMFHLGDGTNATSEVVAASAEATPEAADQGTSSRVRADVATELRTEPWQPPFPLLFVLAAVVALCVAVPVGLPHRRRDRAVRPVVAELHAAGGLRGPPSVL